MRQREAAESRAKSEHSRSPRAQRDLLERRALPPSVLAAVDVSRCAECTALCRARTPPAHCRCDAGTADHFPFLATDATPQRAAKAVPPLSVSGLSSSGPTPLPTERTSASSSSNGTAKKRLGGIFGSRASSRCDTDEAATPPSEQHSLGGGVRGDLRPRLH